MKKEAPIYFAHTNHAGLQQTVKEHLMGTASRAAEFARAFGGEEHAYLAGLLHDIGKYSKAFQRRLAGSSEQVDHSTAGAQVALQELQQLEVAFAAAGHHGGLPDGGSRIDTKDSGTLLGRLKKTVEPYTAWRCEIQPIPAKRPENLPADNFTEFFYIHMLYSCLVDADYIDTETFMAGMEAPRGKYSAISELSESLVSHVKPWLDHADTELNKKRCEILKTCFTCGANAEKGLYTLTVPTGGGKTVASLAFALSMAKAQKMERVIYVIPYTSIIDQNAAVFKQILKPENVVEHHAGIERAVAEEDADNPQAYRKALAVENWDAPVIVTTAVQFFESLYADHPSRCRKLHNIANSVIIFDEAQTLPVPYLSPCVAAIGELVRHYGATAVLCTATQPALQPLFDKLACGLAMREIWKDSSTSFEIFRRTRLSLAGKLDAQKLVARLNTQNQVLCVVNRRSTAQKLYAELKEEGRYCLTTLLCPSDRKRLLAEIRERLAQGIPCRVVSTSLIEAGVDVDFPQVWREEAGLDSILQTAGRCNREGRRALQNSFVFIFQLSGQEAPGMLKQNIAATRMVLREYDDPTTPDAIEAYFSHLLTMAGDKALDQKGILDGIARGMDGRMFPFALVAKRFHLIESPTTTVYIPLGEGQQLVEQLQLGKISRELYHKLGQYAVNIYPQHLTALQNAGAVAPVCEEAFVLLDTKLYSNHTGLSLDIETGNGWFV